MLQWLKRGSLATAAAVASVLLLGGTVSAGAATTPDPGSSWTSSTPAGGLPAFSGTVTSVAPGSFALTVFGRWAVTVDVTPSTVFAETGAVTPPTGVSVGEQVQVTPACTGRHAFLVVTAARVLVVLTHVIGTVQSVGAASFELHLDGGLVLPVSTTATTDVRQAGVRQPGVVAGEYVTAYGSTGPSDPSLLVAQFVVISEPPPPGTLVSGTVASVATGSFLLDRPVGPALTVATPSTTTFGETGSPTAPAGLTAGEQVRVTPVAGPPPSPTTLTAARVVVVLTQVTGTVQSVASAIVSVQLTGGLVVTVDTSGAQVYAADGSPTSHVVVGQKITAYGAADVSTPSRLDGRFVHVDPASGCGGWSDDDDGGDDGSGAAWG